MNSTVISILEFWFGPEEARTWDLETLRTRTAFWFRRNPAVDQQISERFVGDVERAANGDLDHWTASREGAIALIILLDQFPRNLHRSQARAFATDPAALAVTRASLARGDDKDAPVPHRLVAYMPLMHAEDSEVQALSLDRFRALAAEAPTQLKPELEVVLEFAQRHAEIIARFGRYPHRNAALGRQSTPEEVTFLAQPNSSF